LKNINHIEIYHNIFDSSNNKGDLIPTEKYNSNINLNIYFYYYEYYIYVL